MYSLNNNQINNINTSSQDSISYNNSYKIVNPNQLNQILEQEIEYETIIEKSIIEKKNSELNNRINNNLNSSLNKSKRLDISISSTGDLFADKADYSKFFGKSELYNSNFTFNNNPICLNENKSLKSLSKNYQDNSKIENNKKDDCFTNQNFLKNIFIKKNYAFIFLEINNFCLSQKDYFKSIYPEINLVMTLSINDCYLSQEKIYFYRTEESNNIYFPILKKEDLKYNKYRIIKPIEMNDEEFPIKISLGFFTFTNNKLLPMGNEEIFLTLKKDRELEKFNFYHNIYLKYINKKIGNLVFNLAYKIDEIYSNQLIEEIKKSFELLTVKNYFFFIFF